MKTELTNEQLDEILALPIYEQDDEIRAIVDKELPRRIGGYETDEEDFEHQKAQEDRFFEILQLVSARR